MNNESATFSVGIIWTLVSFIALIVFFSTYGGYNKGGEATIQNYTRNGNRFHVELDCKTDTGEVFLGYVDTASQLRSRTKPASLEVGNTKKILYKKVPSLEERARVRFVSDFVMHLLLLIFVLGLEGFFVYLIRKDFKATPFPPYKNS